jgi:hypothetical protein
MVRPRIVPGAIASTFDRLVNQILPRLGINIAVEFFETGWLLFFGTMSDFRVFFGRPMFSPHKSTGKPLGLDSSFEKGVKYPKDAFVWDYSFIRLPPHSPLKRLIEMLKRFYSGGNSIGSGSVEVKYLTDGTTRVRVQRPSLTEYVSSIEEIVKDAHRLFISSHSNVNWQK